MFLYNDKYITYRFITDDKSCYFFNNIVKVGHDKADKMSTLL